MLNSVWLCVIAQLVISYVTADTPANCSYEETRGSWLFEIGDYQENCSKPFRVTDKVIFKLQYPNVVRDRNGDEGTWTMIYNQGFELTIHHRKWLIIFAYSDDGKYFCDKSMPGYTHDTLIRQWKCFKASKLDTVSSSPRMSKSYRIKSNELYRPNPQFVNRINAAQKSWTAKFYPELANFTLEQIRLRAGGMRYGFRRPDKKINVSVEMLELISKLPEEFDWRNPPRGSSVVTPVRDQGACGSCYAFASAAALESRIQIASDHKLKPILSPQDVLECSRYSEGCHGGFPYLVAGKYAEDYGFVDEECNRYDPLNIKPCKRKPECKIYYATNYRYIGGYYGATNAALMQLELVHKGPFPVGFMVYPDFSFYQHGIYHHTGIQDDYNRFDPFEETNHAVVVVGYGKENSTGELYWIVKNSWGESWGENGFFRIRRGEDECGIESLAVSFDAVL